MVTHCPPWYSDVGRLTLPAGPDPLMPNRLWYCAARPLLPQADSSIACAIVTEAGTPNRCWAAIAPGATRLMNDCWPLVPGVTYWLAAGDDAGWADGWPAAGVLARGLAAGADGLVVA